jgi:hypothetical protein
MYDVTKRIYGSKPLLKTEVTCNAGTLQLLVYVTVG